MSILETGLDDLLCFNERNVTEDPDWAALASFKFDSITIPIKEFNKEEGSGGPLDKYFSLVTFQPEVYSHAKELSILEWQKQLDSLTQDTHSEISLFYSRLLNLYGTISNESQLIRGNVHSKPTDDEFVDLTKGIAMQPWQTSSLPGTDPSSWPYGLPELLEKLKQLPPLALWLEPFDLSMKFIEKAKAFIQKNHEDAKLVNMALQALLIFGFLSGNGTRLASSLFEVWNYCSTHETGEEFVGALSETIAPHISMIKTILSYEKPVHGVKPGSMMGRFSAAHNSVFQKNQNCWNTSITTDGEYIYLFIGTQGGGKFKIGTGENGTVCGKVYLYQASERPEEALWVYCKGKLYMRSSFKETGVLQIICPNTFKIEGLLQLFCTDIFGNASKQAFNKYYPLLSDGESLFVVGMKFETIPKPEEEEKKDDAKKKDDPNICKFVLYKFDVSHLQSYTKPQQEPSELAKELHEGFSGYFSIYECQRALAIHNDDIESAANWLVENGDNERGKKIVTSTQSTLLCEADIISYTIGKMQKPEVSLKSDTILTPDLVSRGNWTMSKEQIALHFLNPDGGSATSRIFSVSPNDVKLLPTDAHILPNTTNQVAELKQDENFWNRYKNQEKPLHTHKGSHIINKDCDKAFAMDTATCYDTLNQKFYTSVLNYANGVHFIAYADQTSLKERILLKNYDLGGRPYEAFVAEGLQIIQECEANRFTLPWKWLRWTTMYSRIISKYTKYLRGLTDNDKISAAQKIIEKMQMRLEKLKAVEEMTIARSLGLNPINENTKRKKGETFMIMLNDKMKTCVLEQAKDKPTVVVDNSKEALFSLESSAITLEFLLDVIESDGKAKNAALHLLFLWVSHSRPSLIRPIIIERLENVITNALSRGDQESQQLAWKILIIGWELICSTKEKEIQWFKNILEASWLASPPAPVLFRKDSFLYNVKQTSKSISSQMLYNSCEDPLILWYLKNVYGPSSFIMEKSYNSLFKENITVLVDKQGNESNLATASCVSFQAGDAIIPEVKRGTLGHLLESIWGLFEKGLMSSISDPSSMESQVLFEILLYLVKDASADNLNYAGQLSKLINAVLDKFISIIGDRITTLYTKWLNWIRILIVSCINLSYKNQSQHILRNLIQIIAKVKKLFLVEETNLLTSLCNSFYVGADIAQEKIFETSHPYQRGKQQINETISFPGAIAICIELDPRSQTDNLHDCLWLSCPENYAGFNNFNGEIFSTSFKLSGKINISHQLYLQGDQVHIEFNAAGQHREESNSSRWGFRIRIKPIYGEPWLFVNDNNSLSLLSKIAIKFGGETALIQWISLLNLLSSAVSSSIEDYFTKVQEIQESELLRWQIFKGGLADINIDNYLSKENGTWVYEPKDVKENEINELNIESLMKTLPAAHSDELKALNDGNSFIYSLLDKVRKLQSRPITYNAEKHRKSFTAQVEVYWKQIEALTLYTMLYHTQHLNSMKEWIENPSDFSLRHDEGYIQEQLKAYGKRLNEFLTWLLKTLQQEKEKQQALDEIRAKKVERLEEKQKQQQQQELMEEEKKVQVPAKKKKGKKPNVKRLSLSKPQKVVKKEIKPVVVKPAIKLDESDKEQIYKAFADRFLGNVELIKALCKSLLIQYTEDQKCLRQIYDKLFDKQEDFPNPYMDLAEKIHVRLLILLKFASFQAETNESEITLEEMPHLKRAATSYSHEDEMKIEEMRKWVDSYKKWKLWQQPGETQGNFNSPESSPLQAICTFITSSSIPDDFLSQAKQHFTRAVKRLIGMQYLSEFLSAIRRTPFLRMSLGLMCTPNLFIGAECCGRVLAGHLNEQGNKVFGLMSQALSYVTESVKIIRDPSKRFSTNLKKESKFISPQFQYSEHYINQQMRLLASLLHDCYLLTKYDDSRDTILKSTSYDVLLISLLESMLVASSISHNRFARVVVSGSKLTLFSLIKASKESPSYEIKQTLQQDLTSIILQYLQKEIQSDPSNENSLRLEILLGITYEIISTCGIHKNEDKIKLSRCLSEMLLKQSIPTLIRMASRIAKQIWLDVDPAEINGNFVEELLKVIGSYSSLHLKEEKSQDIKYAVILHTSTGEEDLGFLFQVLLDWEEKYPTYKYLNAQGDDDNAVLAESDASMLEEFVNPSYLGIPQEIEKGKDVPMYYRFLSADSGRGARRKAGKRGGKNQPQKKATGKRTVGSGLSLSKMEKVFDEANKAFEDVKESDTPEERERKIKEKAFIKKIKYFLREAQQAAAGLLAKGVSQIGEPMSLEQARELVNLIQEHQINMFVDTKTKLPILPINPHAKVPPEKPEKEEFKPKRQILASICDAYVAQKIDFVMESGSSLPALKSSEKLTGIVTGSYSHTLLQKPIKPGGSYSLCILELVDLLYSLLEIKSWKNSLRTKVLEVVTLLKDTHMINDFVLGGLVVAGGWSDYIRPGTVVLADMNNTKIRGVVLQGGFDSGFKSSAVIFEDDSHFQVHYLSLSEIQSAKLIPEPEKLGLTPKMLAQALIDFQGNSAWHLTAKRQILKICCEVDWSSWIQSDDQQVPEFMKIISELSKDCPTDKPSYFWERKFLQAWEVLATSDPILFTTPIRETEELSSEAFLLKNENEADDGISGYSLPISSNLMFQPHLAGYTTDQTNFKMMKYWEKYIIARIQDYVRSSFKAFEMEFYFEQLRQPLRLGNQHHASEIAYVLCDQRLPSGIVLPDPKHDWSSLMFDETSVGKWGIAKIKEKTLQQVDNVLIRRMYEQGITQFPVIIRAVDIRAACLLVEFIDIERLELHMCWLPVSVIYPPEVNVSPIPSTKKLQDVFNDYNSKLTGIAARETLLKCMSGIEKGLIGIIDMIKLAVWEELSEDRIEGWKLYRPDFILPNTMKSSHHYNQYDKRHHLPHLYYIEEKLIPNKEPDLVEWAVITWHQLSELISETARNVDIVEVATAIMGNQQPLPSTPENILAEGSLEKKLFPLHSSDTNFAGLVLCFRQETFLCSNSAILFYSDPQGTDLIYEIRAGRQGMNNIPPIVFKTGKVWCTYFTFIDIKCSPFTSSFSGPSIVKCKVYGIPVEWTSVTWITETVSASLCQNPSPDNISLMHSLVDAMCEFLTYSRSPNSLRQIIFRMLVRLMRRLRYMNSLHPQGLGIKEEWLISLIEEMKMWKSKENSSGALYSSYIQDGVELINSALLPWDVKEQIPNKLFVETPEWMQAMFKSTIFLHYFRHEGRLVSELEEEAKSLLSHNQWETIIVLDNLAEDKRPKVYDILSQYKLRVINKNLDIQFIENKCVILADGYNLQYYQETEFGEEEKKDVPEEDAKEPETYQCGQCTFENPISNTVCEICGNPKPAASNSDDQINSVQTNIKEIERKLNANKRESISEFCKAMSGATECTSKVYEGTEEEQKLIEIALNKRMLNEDGTLNEITNKAFEEIWVYLKDWLGEDMHVVKNAFIELAKKSPLELYKNLEQKGIDLWLQNGLNVVATPLPLKQLEAIVEFAEYKICQETRAALYIPPAFIRFPIEKVASINYQQEYPSKEIRDLPLAVIRYNWAIIKVFNQYISEAIRLSNLSEHTLLPKSSLTLSLSSALTELRSLIMLPVKIEMQQNVFDKTAVQRETAPKVQLERLKLIDQPKKASNFYKSLDQLKDINAALLRPPKPQGSDPFIAFEVVLKGELVVGEAGPYRQFFADVSKEIQNPISELLCPSPNNKEHFGEGTDKYVIRPSSNSATHLQMYEFLGLLMGCCARTGTRMTLDLPSFFWKPLVGENLRVEDLALIDTPVYEMLKLMENASQELFEESFENFCTRLSDGSVIDLKPNGHNIPVTYETKDEFIALVLNARFNESSKQSQAIRTGLAKLVPLGLLNLVTWRQLEEWVCGKPHVDIELLKRHTRYSGGLTDTSPRVIWFWESMKEFSPEERLKFIKFSWGQERLPCNDEDFERTNTRLMIKPAMNAEHKDGSLPKADTCFFNLEIPDYSSKEVLKERLRYAILTDCESMNADNPVSEQHEAGMNREEHFSGDEE